MWAFLRPEYLEFSTALKWLALIAQSLDVMRQLFVLAILISIK